MKIEIRKPITPKEWNDYYNMRYNILRKPLNQPLGSERNDGDLDGKHFALYENKILRAIARLDKSEEGISQVRFVAVNSESRGKGFGKLIMDALELHSKDTGNSKIILHARDYAVDFYLKLGYTKLDKSYKLFDVLQHYLMEKIH
jgi:predicted GNAT family N-acyltransferase